MQKNPKLLIIVGLFSLLLIIGMIWTGHQSHSQSKGDDLNSQESIQDKASGDNENEVLRTVLANQEALKTANKKLAQENDSLKQKGMQNVKAMIQDSKQTIQQEIDALKSTFRTQLNTQQKSIGHLHAEKGSENDEYAVNGENTWDNDTDSSHKQVIGTVNDLSNQLSSSPDNLIVQNHLENVEKNNQENNQNNAPTLPSDSIQSNDQQSSSDNQSDKNTITPYYTIPANSTLNHLKLMTAIIGEVPVSGKLVAPAFPFKGIIGKKALYAANGISIPDDLAGTVVEGYSVGNMTLSCARIYVTRLLFVFNDGHFVVYPKRDDNEVATSLYPKDALGYLSDSYGNTCIPGHYITDAPKVIANMAILGGINTGANAVATSQFTTMNNGNALSTGFTGNMSKLVGASIVGGGSQEVLNWYKQRVDDVFDAVFIPASFNHKPTNLVLNITQTIPIDFNQKGRTIRYENKNAYSDYFKQLD